MRSYKELNGIIFHLENSYYALRNAVADLESILDHVDEEGRQLLTEEEDKYVSNTIEELIRDIELNRVNVEAMVLPRAFI